MSLLSLSKRFHTCTPVAPDCAVLWGLLTSCALLLYSSACPQLRPTPFSTLCRYCMPLIPFPSQRRRPGTTVFLNCTPSSCHTLNLIIYRHVQPGLEELFSVKRAPPSPNRLLGLPSPSPPRATPPGASCPPPARCAVLLNWLATPSTIPMCCPATVARSSSCSA
jgi:hypothetical protein